MNLYYDFKIINFFSFYIFKFTAVALPISFNFANPNEGADNFCEFKDIEGEEIDNFEIII